MRMMLSLALLTLLTAGAEAQTLQIHGVNVIDYGIYSGESEQAQAAPDTAVGVIIPVHNAQLVATTRTIPARLGTRFGFRFELVGVPTGNIATLHYVTIFPPPGLQNPATSQVKTQSDFDWNVRVGEVTGKYYTFDNDWEAVPGIWTMQVWYQGRKLAEQSFNVVRQ